MAGPIESSPESIFAAWIARHESGEVSDFEAVCRQHHEHEKRLRELFVHWDLMERNRRQLGLGGSMAERRRSRFGSGADPHVTLEKEGSGGDFSSEVLKRLASHSRTSSRYHLKGEVAHGGMGAILRVWDEDLRRHLAMKVLLGRGQPVETGDTPEVDPRLLARFLEEAQVTGQLDHPGIVPVHELGVDAAGRVFFTMKLVKGKTLEEVFGELARGEGGWTQARVLGLLLRICEAMSYAHAKGVIHRDLKPANVMVGRFGEVYVMDWGLAKILGRENEKDIRVRPEPAAATSVLSSERHDRAGETPNSPLYTMDGDVVGTPAYMSPEQASGHVSDMGPPSDVYAVGAMLYNLLAGHPPYVPPGTRLNNYAVWARVQEGPPRTLHEVAPGASDEITAICEKAMAREPADRYVDMSDLASDLSAYTEGRVVRAYETGAWAQARKWVRRNKQLSAALAVALMATVGGLGGIGYVQAEGRTAEKTQRERAEFNERLAREETAKVLRLSDVKLLQELEADAESLWPAHPEKIRALEGWLDRARELGSRMDLHRSTLVGMRNDARRTAEGGGWRFESTAEQWQHDLLVELLDGFAALELGLLADDAVLPELGWSVPKRLSFARGLEADFAPGRKYTALWERELPRILEAYPGLELGPQMGLVPVGPDPDSELWEFAHLMTGEPPGRGADGELIMTEETGVVLVLLKSGSFWMGAQSRDPNGRNYDPLAEADESPVHEVELSAYFLSKYEMTQAQWKRLAGRNPSMYGPDGRWGSNWLSPDVPVSLLHPVESVTWVDAMAWVPRAGLTLPSEAQWEYGARGGTQTPFWPGSDLASLEGAANFSDAYGRSHGNDLWEMWEKDFDDGSTTHAPIGKYLANPFGLHEIHGNLSEFCLDGYHPDFYGRSPRRDPVASWEGTTKCVARGGGFNAVSYHARSAFRNNPMPTRYINAMGLRPARSVDPRP